MNHLFFKYKKSLITNQGLLHGKNSFVAEATFYNFDTFYDHLKVA